jgi:multicomponent Na+:H+ antiporter subunit C
MLLLMSAIIGVLFAGATYLLLRRSVVKLILGLTLLTHGVNLLLFTMGGLRRDAPPIVGEAVDPARQADPLPQALILTAIVISFGITAFVLALAYRANQAVGSDDLDAMGSADTLEDR